MNAPTEYRPTLDWTHVEEQTASLDETIGHASHGLFRVAELLAEYRFGAKDTDTMGQTGRDIGVAVARAFDALLGALQVAGWYETIGWMGRVTQCQAGAPQGGG